MLTALQGADTIHFHLEYCTSLFKPETIERLAGHLVNLIGEIGRSPQMRLGDIEFLSATEKEQLLYTFAQAEAFDLGEKNLVELFSEQVVKTPDRIALSGETVGANNYSPLHGSVSYKELDRNAAALAGELVEKGVLPNTIVGLKIERSIEMIVGILGILKAGGAYLPIDPEAPEERVQYMLQDSGAEIIIGSQACGEKQIPAGAVLSHQSPSLPAKTVLSFACGFTNCGLSAIRFSMPVPGIAAAPRSHLLAPAPDHQSPLSTLGEGNADPGRTPPSPSNGRGGKGGEGLNRSAVSSGLFR